MDGAGGNSSAVQLRKLCGHILGREASDEVVSSQFRTALQILSSSASGQENVRDSEFVVAEKIKKYLVSKFLIFMIFSLKRNVHYRSETAEKRTR